MALHLQKSASSDAHKKTNCVMGAEELPTQSQGQTVMKAVNGPHVSSPDPNPHIEFMRCILMGLWLRMRELKIAEGHSALSVL